MPSVQPPPASSQICPPLKKKNSSKEKQQIAPKGPKSPFSGAKIPDNAKGTQVSGCKKKKPRWSEVAGRGGAGEKENLGLIWGSCGFLAFFFFFDEWDLPLVPVLGVKKGFWGGVIGWRCLKYPPPPQTLPLQVVKQSRGMQSSGSKIARRG